MPSSMMQVSKVCRQFLGVTRPATQTMVRSLSDKGDDKDKEALYPIGTYRSQKDKGVNKDKEHLTPLGLYRDPIKLLKEEFRSMVRGEIKSLDAEVPRHSDFVIMGGGLVGSAAAYWLKAECGQGAEVTIIEKDYGYTQASTMLSAGGVRHQFSTPENVRMSMFTTKFLENIREYLSVVDQDPPDVAFNHQGYLFLVPPDKVQLAKKNVEMQRSLEAKIALMPKETLASKFPWMNLDGIECGTYGLEGEGWFDPWQLMCALKCKNINLGVRYCKGEVTNFRVRSNDHTLNTLIHVQGVDVAHPNGKVYPCDGAYFINCAGPWAGQLADLAGIGMSGRYDDPRLPVEPRKRFVYVFHCPDGPTLDMPFLVDPSGVYVRREGFAGHYICGASPLSEDEEPDTSNLNVDYAFFNDYIWPKLAERVPAFNNLKLKSAWAGFYDYNPVDQNLIIGPHPEWRNIVFANGMSGHGIQHAIAIGKAISDIFSKPDDFYLNRFLFERLLQDNLIFEQSIV